MKHFNLIKKFFYITVYVYYVLVALIKPEGNIEYSIHWGIFLTLTSIIIFYEGRSYFKIYRKMLKGVFDMHTLIGLGSHIVFVYSIVMVALHFDQSPYEQMIPWEAPGLLIVITSMGDDIQKRLKKDTSLTFKKLNEIRYQNVLVEKNNQTFVTPIKDVQINDVILINKGEIIPLDGISLSDGEIDNSNITGESKILDLFKNQNVISGGYNLGDLLKIKVTKTIHDSTIFKVVENFIKASSNKPKAQLFADKILAFFVPIVLSLSFLTFLTWLIIGNFVNINLPWLSSHDFVRNAIEAGVTVLVIACPCSLGLATPLINLVTFSGVQTKGIIINQLQKMEEFKKIKYVVFDKTGTITTTEMKIINSDASALQWSIAKSLEQNFNHPIAKAFTNSDANIIKLENVKELSSFGIEGNYKNDTFTLKRSGSETINTKIGLFQNGVEVAFFELENIIRDGVYETIQKIKHLNLKTIMMTGDSLKAANFVASKLQIDQVFAAMKPEDKSKQINNLRANGAVLFIGDGFNDSIASQAADISIAFASGSDVVNDLSDFSIINNNFANIFELFKLSKIHNRKIIYSFLWAVIFNVVAIPVAILFLVQPWVGAVIMTLSNILIILNALIYRKKLKK